VARRFRDAPTLLTVASVMLSFPNGVLLSHANLGSEEDKFKELSALETSLSDAQDPSSEDLRWC